MVNAQSPSDPKHSSIMLARGKLDVPARPLWEGSRILVLEDEFRNYPLGSIIVPNAELGERTSKNTTHAVFQHGLLSLDRAYGHMRRKSGLELDACWGEFQELAEGVADYDSIAAVLVSTDALTPVEEELLRRSASRVTRGLRNARNAFKRNAKPQLERGLHAKDRRGRRNPGAAKVAGRAGIDKLQKRMKELIRIMGWVAKRHAPVSAIIADVRALYREMWNVFRPSGYAWNHLDERHVAQLAVLLRSFRERLEQVDILPFSKNAEKCVIDITYALGYIDTGDLHEVHERLIKLQQAALWMSALFQIERIQAEVSFLISWKELNKRARQRRAKGALSVEEEIRELNRRFDRVKESVRYTLQFVEAAADDKLDGPVRTGVLIHLRVVSGSGQTMLRTIHRHLGDALAIL